jgi:hypothetical protein
MGDIDMVDLDDAEEEHVDNGIRQEKGDHVLKKSCIIDYNPTRIARG